MFYADSQKYFNFYVSYQFSDSSKLGDALVIGPSGVRALPLAAGINVGGHYTWHYFGPSGAVQTVSDSRRPLF